MCLIFLDIVLVFDGVLIFILSSIIVLFLILSIARSDLKKPAFNNEEKNLSIAIIFSLLIPVVLFALSIVLILKFDTTIMFFGLIILMAVLLFISYVLYNNSINKNFRKLQVE